MMENRKLDDLSVIEIEDAEREWIKEVVTICQLLFIRKRTHHFLPASEFISEITHANLPDSYEAAHGSAET